MIKNSCLDASQPASRIELFSSNSGSKLRLRTNGIHSFLISFLISLLKYTSSHLLSSLHLVLTKILSNRLYVLLLLPLSGMSIALTAKTANYIQGSNPYFLMETPDGKKLKLRDINQVFQIGYPDKNGNLVPPNWDNTNRYSTNNQIVVPNGTKLSDIITFVKADGEYHDFSGKVDDDDGDADNGGDLSNFSMKAQWTLDGNPVPADKLDSQIEDCGGQFMLTITTTRMVMQTKYGIPFKNDLTARWAPGSNPDFYYMFIAGGGPKLCYFKPQGSEVYTGTAGVNIKYAAGYNPAVWSMSQVTGKALGFKADSGFPTTGFEGAQFQLIMNGGNTAYSCYITSGEDQIQSVSNSTLGQKCIYKFGKDRPTKDIVIHVVYGNSWENQFDVTIRASQFKKWAFDKLSVNYYHTGLNSYFALKRCSHEVYGESDSIITQSIGKGLAEADKSARQKYLYRIDEITDAPVNVAETALTTIPNSYPPQSYFSRDIGTFMGEWGAYFIDQFYGNGTSGSASNNILYGVSAQISTYGSGNTRIYNWMIDKKGGVSLKWDVEPRNSDTRCRGELVSP